MAWPRPTLGPRCRDQGHSAGAVLGFEGVECAHEKGIVHRDLKPANDKLTADVSAPRKHVVIGEHLTRPQDCFACDDGDIIFTHRAEGEGELRSLDLALGFAPKLAATVEKAGATRR